VHPQALNQLRQLDRADLALFLVAVNGASNSLRRDDCGDPVIVGTRGTIRATSSRFSIFVACRSSKHWRHLKKALAGFCIVTRDGDDEGVLEFTRLPAGEEAARLRAVVGLRRTRPSSAADHLNRPPRAVSESSALEGAKHAKHAPEPEKGSPSAPGRQNEPAGPKETVDAEQERAT
jgi:hypothetical protein